MTDVVVGLLALVIGLLLCFRGHGAMRVLLAVWGGFMGFGLGAVLVAAISEQSYLASAMAWFAAIVLALVFAGLAYVFFAVAVVIAFASMGFVLGQTIGAALGVSEPWLLTGVGVAGGLALGLLAVATNLPDLVLIVVSALAGAAVAVGGLMLLVDALDLDALAETQLRIGDQPGWYVGQLVLAVVGVVVQLRATRRRRLGTVRRSWAAAAQ